MSFTKTLTTAPSSTPTEHVQPYGRCTSQDGDCEMWHTAAHFPLYDYKSSGGAIVKPIATAHTSAAAESNQGPSWVTITHTNGGNNAVHLHTLLEPAATSNSTGVVLSSSTSVPA